MHKTKLNKILEQVENLLQENQITDAPVDVESIADSKGIKVRRSPTDDDISGFLLPQPNGTAVIGVNSLHHPNRQRFTIGHEIAHFVLHDKEGVHVDRRLVVRHRDSDSSTGEVEEEVEANRFAAELLMPRKFLEQDLEEISPNDLLDDREMQQLAKRYQVSVQAMTNRLISLGYLNADELGTV